MLIIQHIHTTWTKASRGMPEAAARNAVPRTLPLPLPIGAIDDCYLHHITYRESDSFTAHGKTESLQQAKQYWSLNIDRQERLFVISFTYDPQKHGHPSRRTNPPRIKLFTLEPGQIGCFHINGRFSYGAQWYEQHHLNMAHVMTPDTQLFTHRQADYFIDKTALLF